MAPLIKNFCIQGTWFFTSCLLLLMPSCHLEVLDPIRNGLIAEFDYAFSNQEGDVPIEVNFVNRSTEAVSYRWDFGDGSVLSSEFNPRHNYTKAGDYTITLTAVNELGEEDFISIPLTLTSRRFVKEWPLEGNSGFIFTGFAPVSDSAYLFTGSGDLYPFGCLLTDLYGDTLSTSAFRAGFATATLVANVPGYYLEGNFSNSVGYEENGTVRTRTFHQPDLFLFGEHEDFGYPNHIVYETEGENGGASLMYIGSEGTPLLRPNLMNFFESGFSTSWPIILDQYCRLTGITISPEGGVIGIGLQMSNCTAGLRIESYDAEGNRLKFKSINVLPESESWKIIPGNPGQYIAVGNYPEDRRLTLYVMDDDFNIVSQSFIPTEQDIFELKDAKSGADGSFFVVGETSSSSSQVKAFKVNNAGNSMWSQTYDFPTKVTSVNGIYPTNDCGLLIYGSYYAGFNPDAPLIIKTDQDGLIE